MKKLLGLGLAALLFVPSVGWSLVGGGNVVFRPAGSDNVIYSHDDHVIKAGLRCSECHYKLYTTVGHRKKATMDDMEKGQSCGVCHNGQRAFAVKGNCAKCHK
jgi:c(7)-type cytochrome triheme protein